MINLKQVKNDYVRDNYLASHDLDTWFEFQNYFASRHPEWFEQHYNNIIEIVQMECLKLASERACIEPLCMMTRVDKKSITNENNIIR